MSEQNPYQKLGVSEHASFEEIQEAKKRLSQQFSGDAKVVESIEAAYDAIIMDRLKLRQEGKIPVPERIRFPERSPETIPSSLPKNINKAPSWLSRLIDTPSKTEILWSTGIYASLVALTLLTQNATASSLSLFMALGFCASIYLLSRKEGKFGRALLISAIALVAGVGFGAGLVNLLIAQSGNMVFNLNGDQIASILTLFLFWVAGSFLR
jgi:hypothetical protein